jgi:trans-aconitate 2-methyltransferase
MPTWNADQYLKFADERTRPCRDLVNAIALRDAPRIMDLGCGPGNSTSVLGERWPEADITGLDSSDAMINVARSSAPQRRWITRDITDWADNAGEQFGLVFSNAALHWSPDHESLFPKLMERVLPGGALAVQMPANLQAPAHRLMRELAPRGITARAWHSHEPSFYYDVLAPHAARVDIWQVEYQHIMSGAEAIVEWYKGSGLRPFLEAITSESERTGFLEEYTRGIRDAYPPRPDGKVLFPFLRLFIAAYK